VRLHRHRHDYHFSPPIVTFPLTEAKRAARLAFARHHLAAQRD
jgi:hypothetical protein